VLCYTLGKLIAVYYVYYHVSISSMNYSPYPHGFFISCLVRKYYKYVALVAFYYTMMVSRRFCARFMLSELSLKFVEL